MKFRFGVALALLPLLAACSGGGATKGETGADGVTKVKIGLIPIAAVAPIYLGMEKGFFKEHGLELEPVSAASGSSIIPALVSGQEQFGFSNVVSVLLANERGLPLRVVAKGSQAGPGDSSKFEGILVRGDSHITSVKDLEGKTVSVNALKTIGSTLIDASLRKQGVDVSKLKYTEIPFSDANAAVESGRVDAAYQTEPFLTAAKESGMRVLQYHYEELAPEVWIANYVTTEQYAKANPDVVDRFQAAVTKSLNYANEHQDEARAILDKYTDIDPELVKKMVLPKWDPSLDLSTNGLSVVVDAAVQGGLIPKAPDLDKLILE